jgi:putative NADPH-quinone reductase
MTLPSLDDLKETFPFDIPQLNLQLPEVDLTKLGRQKKTLVILGHPDDHALGGALADAYIEGAKLAGAPVRVLRLADLDFDPVLHKGYKQIQPLEPDLQAAQADLIWAEHVVFVYPTWWGGPPALLKGFLDRVLLPGFSFQFQKNGLLWKRLLRGRTARLITTMDAPYLGHKLLFGDPGKKMMKNATLFFVGISPVRTTVIDLLKFLPHPVIEAHKARIRWYGRFQV